MIRPKSSGSASEQEISKHMVIEAEKEYVKLVEAIRTGKELPPTPTIDHIRSNGDEILWFFKDRKKFEAAIEKTEKLWKGWSSGKIGNLTLFEGLYHIVTKKKSGGYGLTYYGYKPLIKDIDGTVSEKDFQCVEGFAAIHGHELLVAGLLNGVTNIPEVEIYQTASGTNYEHLVIGFRVMHGAQKGRYIIDPENEDNPIHMIGKDELKDKIRIEKTHVLGLYYLEQAYKCFNERGMDRKCVEQNIERVSRYAGKSFFTTFYGVARLKDLLGDCIGAKRDVESILKTFPRSHVAYLANQYLAHQCTVNKDVPY